MSHVRRATCYLRGTACVAMMAAGLLVVACGGSPSQPAPIVNPPPPPPPINLSPNTVPVIDSISVQGTRRNEPPNFADVSETVNVVATVKDEETAVDQLQYNWTATVGTFAGTGARVTWQVPATASTPATVTLALEVVERYGTNQEHRATKTATVDLHNSTKEIGDMTFRFLTEFSKPQANKDWRDIMRDFKASACPDPGEIDSERADVERHYNYFVMHNYRVDPPSVTINFGGSCPWRFRAGDGCAAVPVMWDSTDTRDNVRAITRGTDHISAAFSTTDKRWYLCSSYFQPANSFGHAFYGR
jgi:hypothetical protein